MSVIFTGRNLRPIPHPRVYWDGYEQLPVKGQVIPVSDIITSRHVICLELFNNHLMIVFVDHDQKHDLTRYRKTNALIIRVQQKNVDEPEYDIKGNLCTITVPRSPDNTDMFIMNAMLKFHQFVNVDVPFYIHTNDNFGDICAMLLNQRDVFLIDSRNTICHNKCFRYIYRDPNNRRVDSRLVGVDNLGYTRYATVTYDDLIDFAISYRLIVITNKVNQYSPTIGVIVCSVEPVRLQSPNMLVVYLNRMPSDIRWCIKLAIEHATPSRCLLATSATSK